MLPEPTEPAAPPERFPDPFPEPRDHALQWDVSALWPDRRPQPADEKRSQPKPAPVVEV